METKVEGWKLKQRQSLPLEVKILKSKRIIKDWYENYNGEVYVAFSGGKDSTVMLHLVRSIYPDVKAVFVDTGLEYPELKEFVKTTDNVETIRPKMGFIEVIEKYGYPVISKSVSMAISRYRNTKREDQKDYRLNGRTLADGTRHTAGTIPKRYHYMVDAPFKISERCCDVMKKQPFHRYEKETGLKPFIGLMASDSDARKVYYMKNGCNAFDSKDPKSLPIGFWMEEDIWAYIKQFDLDYCSIYDTGVTRTGCMFCMFGLQKDDPNNNRFDIMKKTHPMIYNYCMDKLKIQQVLEYMNPVGKKAVEKE